MLDGRLRSVSLSRLYSFHTLHEPILITAGVFFSLIGGGLVWVITKWGLDMQQWAEQTFDLNKKPDF